MGKGFTATEGDEFQSFDRSVIRDFSEHLDLMLDLDTIIS